MGTSTHTAEVPAARAINRRWAVVVLPAAFVALVALQLLRQAGHPPWHTIFAEDGPVFFVGTTRLSEIFEPYAGYMQIVGRVIGLGGHAVPLDQLARYFSVAGAVLTTLCVFAVWMFSRRFVSSPWLRGVVALSVVLLPTVVYEQLGNGVNALWATLFAGWWALIDRPRTWKGAIPAACVAAIAAMASGLAALYFPFAVILAWQRRSEPYRAVAGAYAAGLVVQAIVVMGADRAPVPARPTLVEFPKIIATRLFGSALIGEQSVATAWDWFGVGFAIVAAVVVLGILAWLAACGTGEARMLGVASVACAVVAYIAALVGRGAVIGAIGERYIPNSTRYQSLAIWLLLSGLVLLASSTSFAPRAKHVLVGVIVAWFAITAIVGFRVVNPRSSPTMIWATSVADARALCRAREASSVIVVVVPTTFDFSLRCDEILKS